jgi:hypothetical protein
MARKIVSGSESEWQAFGAYCDAKAQRQREDVIKAFYFKGSSKGAQSAVFSLQE